MTDVEKGALLPKGKQAKLVEDLKKEPVGGTTGNPMFWVYLQLAVRGAVFSCVMATLVWVPATSEIGDLKRFKAFMPLAICVFIFTINPIFGQVVDNATAGILGTFVACLNIFILRGFFAEGVEPGMGHFSTPSIVAWTDLCIFNLLCLICNVRMAFRMFAMATNTGFILMFLNPADQTPFSKNFKINMQGTAVSSFIGVSIGSVCGIVAMCLPYPWRFAYSDMKSNANAVSADTCKLFSAAVDYFKGANASVIINQQLAQTAVLKAELGSMGGSIGAAWNECWDIGNAGTVRHLMDCHAGMLGKVYDILYSLEIALSTEDFGDSHKQVMKDIGATATDLVQKTNLLLMEVTHSAGDGEIDASEKESLNALMGDVKAATKELSRKFDASRRAFAADKPVCQELLSESFFVFALSAYGRLVCEYTNMLCTDPPKGSSFGGAVVGGIKGIVSFPSTNHDRFTMRYWLAMMLCFVFGVVMDNYGGACAITAVFLLNTRVGPDMMATLNTLLAVVVGCVVGAIVYSYSCFSGQGSIILPVLSFVYWVGTIHIGYSGSSFALIGLLMAALAPFTMVKECPSGVPSDTGGAGGLWINIRGTIIAMIIVSLCEILSVPGAQGDLAFKEFDAAMQKLKESFGALWKEQDPLPALEPVSGLLASSSNFNSGARLEPRYWKCKWKADFMDQCVDVATKIRVDILTIKMAMDGGGQRKGPSIFGILNSVPAIGNMQKDLAGTLEDAREIAIELLDHGYGPFSGMTKLDSLEGVDKLDGFDDALAKVCGVGGVKFPASAPDSMEDDLLCQLSIIFVMLDYSIKHVAEMIKCTIRQA